MDDVAQGVALGLAGLIAVTGLIALLRRPRAVSTGGLLIGSAATAAVAAFYWTRFGVELKGGAAIALLLGGALAGLAAGRSLTLTGIGSPTVAGCVTRLQSPYLLALAGVQAAGAFQSIDWLIVTFAALVAASAFSVVGSLTLAVRVDRLRRRPPSKTCTACPAPVVAGWHYCMDCGAPVGAADR